MRSLVALLMLPAACPLSLPLSSLPTQTRPDFPILKTCTYLDNSATTHKPLPVLSAMDEHYNERNANVHRGAHRLSRAATEAYETARSNIAKFMNANAKDLIFTSGATESLNLIARSWGDANLSEGDEIVLTVMEHHSNIVPWQMLKNRRPGINIKFCPLSADGGLDYEALEGLITERTKVVSVVHTSNVLGCTTDTSLISSLVKLRAHPDSIYVVDGCQSLPHGRVDVEALGCDFYVASAHKMCGPTGIGALWGRAELLDSMDPYLGGGEMIDIVTQEGFTVAERPGKFEAGTPKIAEAVGWGAAVKYLEGLGMERVEGWERELSRRLYERVSSIDGVTVHGPSDPEKRSALVAFSSPHAHASDLASFLDLEGICVRAGHHCAQPLHEAMGVSHTARASAYFYTSMEDVDTFADQLEQTIKMFKDLEDGGGEGFML